MYFFPDKYLAILKWQLELTAYPLCWRWRKLNFMKWNAFLRHPIYFVVVYLGNSDFSFSENCKNKLDDNENFSRIILFVILKTISSCCLTWNDFWNETSPGVIYFAAVNSSFTLDVCIISNKSSNRILCFPSINGTLTFQTVTNFTNDIFPQGMDKYI